MAREPDVIDDDSNAAGRGTGVVRRIVRGANHKTERWYRHNSITTTAFEGYADEEIDYFLDPLADGSNIHRLALAVGWNLMLAMTISMTADRYFLIWSHS
jgi:hypothetical protein